MSWIRAGRIRVDGRVVKEPLTWVDLGQQRITLDGDLASGVVSAPREDDVRRIATLSAKLETQRARTDKSDLKQNDKPRLVIALHKPVGVVTTRQDERGRRTVYDLLPLGLPWVFPAGRLDADSEGLLILSNDSALSVRLTEPAEHVPKTYQVTVRGKPTTESLEQLRKGIRLKDGPTRPVKINVIHSGEKSTLVEMTLTEGRNRQIRRMWHAVGHKVKRLMRVRIGQYALGNLNRGKWCLLSNQEIQMLTRRT
jgi:23S rRNA pseudouridine2605 synthase